MDTLALALGADCAGWPTPGQNSPLPETSRDAAPQPISVEDIYHQYHARLRGLALSLVGNDADADDVAQEALLQVVRHLQTFRGESTLTTWLHRVTVNAALHFRRQVGTHREFHLDQLEESWEQQASCGAGTRSCGPAERVLQKELSECLEQAIAQLPLEYRVVYVASELEGLSNAEIGDRCGLSLSAVKSRLHRGRLMLRSLLACYCDEFEE